ncbi:MAG: cytochrome C [Candidatus Aminicenantes bacterium]|nr:cytochrome C [Candidatus Aminicenantes bacterium]
MKKLFIFAAALTLTVGAFGQGTIVGSAHDFSTEAWNTGGQICVVCHTPHNADLTINDSPLWNHEVTTATYTLYSSSTLDATPGQPGGYSKLCLSCHDGTVALDSFGGETGSTNISGNALFGTDLSNDHPISITYDTSLASTDGELYDPTTASSGLGGTIDADMLFASKMECASCHDVHNKPGIEKLLLKSNAASALCLTCHSK